MTGTSNTLSVCSSSIAAAISTCTLASTKVETKNDLSATSTFNPGDPATSQSSISLGTGTANNSSATTVTITVKDQYANAISGLTPTYELLNGLGIYTTVSACSSTNSSGVSTCTFRTFRGNERIARITYPTELITIYSRANLTCSKVHFLRPDKVRGAQVDPYQISTVAQLDQIRCSTS